MTLRLAIGICSGQAPQYAERRRWCRDTWLSGPAIDGIGWFFCVGGGTGPARVECDTLITPCRDDASGCSDKSKAIFRHALDLGAEYGMRVCDDTYLARPRLARHPLWGDYGGCVLPGKSYCSGGAGYWLSRRAMAIVVNELPDGIYAEDQAVGELLARHGIQPVDDQRFRSWYPDDKVGPRPDNDLISTHALRTWELFDEVHRAWVGG